MALGMTDSGKQPGSVQFFDSIIEEDEIYNQEGGKSSKAILPYCCFGLMDGMLGESAERSTYLCVRIACVWATLIAWRGYYLLVQ